MGGIKTRLTPCQLVNPFTGVKIPRPNSPLFITAHYGSRGLNQIRMSQPISDTAQYAMLNPSREFIQMVYRIATVKISDGTISPPFIEYKTFAGLWFWSEYNIGGKDAMGVDLFLSQPNIIRLTDEG